MAEIGSGYGSECHLLRFLGRHRQLLDFQVQRLIGADAVDWLDFPFDPARRWLDGEWKGLDFLNLMSPARQAWRDVWPQRGQPPNWDAVGRVTVAGQREWLLVEAKGNLEEIASNCAASPAGGRPLIDRTLARTKAALGVAPAHDWLTGYYQHANRLAVLHHLQAHGEPARLLFIYFTGDRTPGRTCPANEAEWQTALSAQARHLGLPGKHPLADRVHKLFLPVLGD